MGRRIVKKNTQKLTSAKGFTLLEVLVAMIVLAIGLLGLAGLQAVGLRSSHSSYFRSQATSLAYDIMDRMRANRTDALGKNYNIKLSESPPTSSSSIPEQDLIAWFNQLTSTLPSGDGAISCEDSFICTIIVQWDDSRGQGGSSLQQFVTTTQL